MDLNLQSPSPDDADGKPSFCKLSTEAVHKKYRRPVNESPSPLSDPGRGRSRGYHRRDDFDRSTTKERDKPALERQKPKERHSSYDRHTSHRRPSSSNLDEVKTGGRDRRDMDRKRDPDDMKPSFRKRSTEAVHKKYRRPVNESPSSLSDFGRGYHRRDDFDRSTDKEREIPALERQKPKERHPSSDRDTFHRRPGSSNLNEVKTGGRDSRDRDRKRDPDDMKPSFRKPSTEAVHRKFHRPVNESPSSSSDSGRGRGRGRGYHRRDDFDRSTDKDRDIPALERQKPKEKHSSSDRGTSHRRPSKTGGRDRRDRDRKRGRDDRKDCYRDSAEYKSNYSSLSDSREERKDLTTSKDRSGSGLKETKKGSTKELDRENDEVMEKGKHDGWESDRLKARYGRESDEKGNRSFTSGEENWRNEHYEDKTSGKRLKLSSGSGDHHEEEGQLILKSVSVAGEGMPSNSKQPPDAAVSVLANSSSSSRPTRTGLRNSPTTNRSQLPPNQVCKGKLSCSTPHSVLGLQLGKAMSTKPKYIRAAPSDFSIHCFCGNEIPGAEYFKRIDFCPIGLREDADLEYNLISKWINFERNDFDKSDPSRVRLHYHRFWRIEHDGHAYELAMTQEEYFRSAVEKFDSVKKSLNNALNAACGFHFGDLGRRRLDVSKFLSLCKAAKIYPSLHKCHRFFVAGNSAATYHQVLKEVRVYFSYPDNNVIHSPRKRGNYKSGPIYVI